MEFSFNWNSIFFILRFFHARSNTISSRLNVTEKMWQVDEEILYDRRAFDFGEQYHDISASIDKRVWMYRKKKVLYLRPYSGRPYDLRDTVRENITVSMRENEN